MSPTNTSSHRLARAVRWSSVLLASSAWLSACEEPATQGATQVVESEEPTSDLEALLEGAPDPSTLPDELKADQTFPAQFDLVATQSPVKSQGSRGVCSIFSTVALMEHLYMKEGAVAPDFSEQFLQWSVKSELGRFTKTSGSNGSANIEAIHRFGVVEESVMPYETFAWSGSNDPACETTGDKEKDKERPTFCYTNGEPEEQILDARRWTLPSNSRWVSSNAKNLKAFLVENETAVVVGMTFFYQSWNHRKSPLPVSSEYKRQGYVMYPNAKDREHGEEKGAGHSILIVGWDDELEVPVLDHEGKQVLDEDGEPVVERGFFLFKNSWGTSAFGTANPFSAGYGWLSMRYVEEFGRSVSTRPPNEALIERCDDGLDNNFDGLTDCADVACGEMPVCRVEPVEPTPEGLISEYAEVNESIPDHSASGVVSSLYFGDSGLIKSLKLTVDIEHPYRSDLYIELTSPSGERALIWDREGRNATNLNLNVEVTDFVGDELEGVWELYVADEASGDEGSLLRWGLTAELK